VNKGIVYHSRRVAQAEFKHSRTPSVAEAGVIVATVGALSLSLIVPVESFQRQ
jgi:hypothetical protein